MDQCSYANDKSWTRYLYEIGVRCVYTLSSPDSTCGITRGMLLLLYMMICILGSIGSNESVCDIFEY